MRNSIPMLAIFHCFLAIVRLTAAEPTVNVRELGAVADGKAYCTEPIQKAIDRCAEAGGGMVHFPPGTYLSGTIVLKSNVTLNLAAGATLLGSPKLADYPPLVPKNVQSRTNAYNVRSLIYAENLDRIAITGRGTIDGSGGAYKDRRHDGNRPLILRAIDCRDVLVENITMQNSGFWNQHYLVCERVVLRGIRVFNHATYNADGVDIDGCRDFILTDSFIDSDDDAVCLKSTLNRPCENVLVSNCVVSSHCNAVKMGTDSTGGFVNVTIANCAIVSPRHSKVIYGLQRGISGISLELVDGGKIDRVTVSNVTIDGVEVPLFVRLGNRGTGFVIKEERQKTEVPVGAVRNVLFNNIVATRAGKTGCSVVGIPGHCVENVSFNNVSIRGEGGGKSEWSAAKIKELPANYPEGTMFGKLPAYGLYCRHVRGLTLADLRLETDEPDGRHALALDDVVEANVSGLSCAQSRAAAALVGLLQSRDVLFRGCQPRAADGVFLRLAGKDTANVSLLGNDVSRVKQLAEFADEAAPASLRAAGNLPKD
ncbi:MAG: glycoside hydrolase family 28 protein [Pirellulales bacterium]|nr:glycoside hydrolase family 28 protein [Pirellulales bacterium]